jgi:probable F420-dependent oxidoreductase
VPYLVTAEHTARAREILGEGPLLAPELKVVLEPDPARARAIARETLAMYLALPNYTNNFLRLGFTEDDVTDGGSDRLVDAVFAWGDEAAVRDRIDTFHQAGADHVALQVVTGGPREKLPREEWRRLAYLLG